MSEVLEGDAVFERHEDGRVEVTRAPARTRISLELLACADPVVFKVSGNLITLGGQVVYRVVGWDNFTKALLVDLVEDRRGVPGVVAS